MFSRFLRFYNIYNNMRGFDLEKLCYRSMSAIYLIRRGSSVEINMIHVAATGEGYPNTYFNIFILQHDAACANPCQCYEQCSSTNSPSEDKRPQRM